MHRRGFLGVAAAPLLAQTRSTRPNFLILLADDLSRQDVGCYGNRFIETPNIDALAAQGMRFTNAYSAGPVCSPTRASLQAGLYPARVGINCVTNPLRRPWAPLRPPPNRWNLPRETSTLAEMLVPAGYRCGLIGKWHLGEEPGNDPWHRGYERLPAPDSGTLRSEYRSDVARFAERYPHKGAGSQTLQAISFLEGHNEDPFLCFVNYNLPHLPITASAELTRKYAAKPGAEQGDVAPGYAAMVEAMDQSIGHILRSLDVLGLAENTLVWFLSDNGGVLVDYHALGPLATTNAPYRGEKGSLYEGGIRIPSVVRWPGVIAGNTTSAVQTITNDLAPTILELAGGDAGRSFDGVSLARELRGKGALQKRDLFWHYPFYHHSTPASAVISGQSKLIEFFETNALELYDLAADPGERKNLATVKPALARRLHVKLKSWRAAVGAAMPVPNPDYDPSKAGLWGARAPKPWMPPPKGLVNMTRECEVFFDLVPRAGTDR